LDDKDLSLERIIYKAPGYQLHSARIKSSGETVVMKVYQGSHAKKVDTTKCCLTFSWNRCLAAAIFMIKQRVMHSNVLHLIAVPPRKSESSFLIFDGEYEGTVDLMLGHALNKKNLEQSLILGMRTVRTRIACSLDYLHDLNYPFASVGLDHFVLLNCRGKIIISFDPDELPVDQLSESDKQFDSSNRTHWAMQIFHGLCQKARFPIMLSGVN
ncbi:hypothetical protein BYT27DRAFT_7106477, partial [Phlegmacium glaucopus]